MNSKKILIIHDRFQFRGGAERLVLILARALDADIATEFWIDETYSKSEVPRKLFILDEGEPPQIVWRYFRAQFNFLFKTRKLVRDYDVVIFSGNNCLTTAFHLKGWLKRLMRFRTREWRFSARSRTIPANGGEVRGRQNSSSLCPVRILYCHSPVRHVYDLWAFNRSQQEKWWKCFLYYDIGKWGIRAVYRLGLAQMNRVLANSKNVQARLWQYCRTWSEVVYPPIVTHKFKWISQGDYYLSFARLDELKRVEDIVCAFQKLPDKKLVVASGGSELEKIQSLARGYANISVLGWVEHEKLYALVGNCIATVYIPINEDFGMSNLESLAAGKPVIAVRDGGLVETMEDEVHAKFIPKEYSLADLIAAIEWMTPGRALTMRRACEEQAKKFDEKVFVEKIKEIIDESSSEQGYSFA